MANKTYLEVIGAYGDTGWQDADGIEHFNDRVACDYGLLGKLKVEFEDGFPIIVQADELVLIRRGFPHAWTTSTVGAQICENPFGFARFRLTGKNGRVEYRLIEDELAWKPQEKQKVNLGPSRRILDGGEETQMDLSLWQLGIREYENWTPMLDTPERYRNETTTTVIQKAR